MTVSIATITRTLENLTTVSKESAALAQQIGQDTSAAYSRIGTDFTLTEDGKQRMLTAASGDIKTQAKAQLDALTVQGNAAYRTLERAMQENRPRRGTDAASVIVAQQRWDQSKEILSAGIQLNDLIATSDLVTTLAIEEFAPSWLVAQRHLPMLGEELTNAVEGPDSLARAILSRLLEITTGEVAFALAAARDADVLIAQAQLWWKAGQGMIDGRNTNYLETAISAEYIGRNLSTRAKKDTPRLPASDPTSPYVRYNV